MPMFTLIREWLSPTCVIPGCGRRKPKFTRICDHHAGPNNENV